MTAVLVVQALALHDGGVGTLGANVFNMGVVGVSVAALCLRAVCGRGEGNAAWLSGVALAGAASMLAAVAAMGAELALSGAARGVFAAAVAAHAPFAAFEIVATVAVAALLARAVSFELGVERVER
jgi:cobalt/nickel transport system permease protein